MTLQTEYGQAHPLGASLTPHGVNFSVFSRSATRVDLLLYDRVDDAAASRIIRLERPEHRTWHYWHAHVPGLAAGQLYAYRVHGPFDPGNGHRFNAEKVLLDPYARAVAVPPGYSRIAASGSGANDASATKSVVVDVAAYDWEGDCPPRNSPVQTVVYEMHVRGFTRHESSGLPESLRGTFAGAVQKIPYLLDLGVTAVELLPVFHFDPLDCPPGLTNYWGYAPVSFFAPHPAYSSRSGPMGPVDEFRDMVKALHRAGIEVILDVVYNHTAEGDEHGPTLGLRGLENDGYYILDPTDPSRYANFSGTGNTINANHPVVRRMILDSLRYWVTEMHVDGFRFDLASILARDSQGHVLPNPPVLWDIETDPVLAGVKLIAEAWDAAGLYQVGSFVGDNWREWNGRFRDDVRDFFRGVPGSLHRAVDRMLGSHEVYGAKCREPEQSVNFVTCHDGFTLNDLVTYELKRNEANGEGNRDGCDDNRGWNCGVEGPTDDPGVQALRNRQVKNMITLTLLSLGLPMITMGDEIRRTQLGNNNAYCQDNPISWLDWTLLERHGDVHRFVKLLLSRRTSRSTEHERLRMSLSELLQESTIHWHGTRLHRPDWGEQSRSIAVTVGGRTGGLAMHLILNAYWEPMDFELPYAANGKTSLRRWIDTARASPDDIVEWDAAVALDSASYTALPRSVVVLLGHPG